MNSVKSFYVNSRACVKVDGWVGERFEVKVVLRQGCVMSPWLFNVYMDSIVREVKRECREEGLNLQSERGGVQWRVNMLLYADDTVLIGETEESLQRLVTSFDRICRKRKVRINGDKSKVMRVGDNGRILDMGIRIGRVRIKQVDCFNYLGVVISAVGEGRQEFGHRLKEGNRALGGVREVWNRGRMSVGMKRRVFESIVVPKVMYGSETWSLNAKERSDLEVFEMKGLRSMYGVSIRDRVRNVRIRERCGWERGLVIRYKQSVLKWYGHVLRGGEDSLVGRVARGSVERNRGRGRPKWRW